MIAFSYSRVYRKRNTFHILYIDFFMWENIHFILKYTFSYCILYWFFIYCFPFFYKLALIDTFSRVIIFFRKSWIEKGTCWTILVNVLIFKFIKKTVPQFTMVDIISNHGTFSNSVSIYSYCGKTISFTFLRQCLNLMS